MTTPNQWTQGTEATTETNTALPGAAFHLLFEHHALRHPDNVAVRDERETVTYGELNHRANQIAHLLLDRGIRVESTVGVCFDRCAAMAAAVLGILKAGGAYVPVDPRGPAEHRLGILRDADVRVALAGTGVEGADDVVVLDRDWGAVAGLPTENPRVAGPVSSRAAYILYTSGSTGAPKGVVVEHRQLTAYITGAVERFGISGPLSFAMVQPLWVDSSVTAFALPLCTGGEVHMLSRETALDAGRLADWGRTHGVDCLKIAPSHLRALQSSPRFAELLPRRLLVVGGEPSDWRWLKELQEANPGCRVFNHYGPTETTVGVTTLAVADHPRATEWHTSPIGVPLPGTTVHIVDAEGRPVPDGHEGEMLIGGANVARGYHRRDDLTAAAFIPDPASPRADARLYRTGDFARRLPDGTIEFIGRADDQIKIRGFRVELGEVDAALLAHGRVRNAVTLVREDAQGDRRLVSYVEISKPESFDTSDLERHLRERLPSHMIPQDLVPLIRLPLSGHGKIDRSALPAPATDYRHRGTAPPTTRLERVVAQVWADVLRRPVGADQNFFDIGGHSLLLVDLQHRLREAVGRDVDLLDLFSHPTVHAQARLLEKQDQRASTSPGAERPNAALLRRRQQQSRARRAFHD